MFNQINILVFNKTNQKLTEPIQSTQFIGKEIYRYNTLDSTNNCAKQLIAKSKPSLGTVIMADFQSAGRGQGKNNWVSSPGQNVLMSVILYPENLKASDQFWLNKAISIALCQFLRQFAQLPALIKWPNDVLINEEKISGLLVENSIQQSQLDYTIIGLGLNVNQQFFPDFNPKATSLFLQNGLHYQLMKVVDALLPLIEQYYVLCENQNFDLISSEYDELLFGLNQPQQFLINDVKRVGIIQGVDDAGRLNVLFNSGLEIFDHKEIKFIF